MILRAARLLAGLAITTAGSLATAQTPTPPSFAPPNLTPDGVRDMAAACAMCHGTNGRTQPNSPVASLAGKPRDEIVQTMGQFKAGTKPATIMHQIAKGYGDAEIAALAEYFSRQPR
jgi:cytochrome c553